MSFLKLLSCTIFLALAVAPFQVAVAQNKELINTYLSMPFFEKDTAAPAVILYEKANTEIADKAGIYKQSYRVHRMVKVFKSSGIGWGEVKGLIVTNDKQTDVVTIVSATTYNLKDGRIAESHIDNNGIKYNRKDKNYDAFSFTMPNVAEGSVIDYEYLVNGPMHTLLPTWEFQGLIPKLSSAYEVRMPQALSYQLLTAGYFSRPFFNFRTEKEALNARSDFYTIVASDLAGRTAQWYSGYLPALKSDQFLTKIDNYVQAITLQVNGNRWDHPDSLWKALNDELWRSEHFGAVVTGHNNEMQRLADSLTQDKTDTFARAKAIFHYVRDRFENNNNPGFVTRRETDQLLAHNSAGPAEINLLMAGMLRAAGIKASPVLVARLGTRQALFQQPDFSGFNYTIVRVFFGGKWYYLDASNRFNAWDYLPIYCFNGMAWVVDKQGSAIALNNQMAADRTAITLNVTHITDTDMLIQGEERKGRIEANYLRNIFTSDTGVLNKYVTKMYKQLYGDVGLLFTSVENLYDPDNDLTIKYVVKVPVKKDNGKINIATDILKLFAKNPFVSDTRALPVYFPSTFQYYYDLRIDIPSEKVAVNIPSSFSGAMPGNELAFKHSITTDKEKNRLLVNTAIAINSPDIPPSSYAYLKAFYQKMYNEIGYEIGFISK